MKILDKETLTGNISKMVETPDNFIINGHLYDKNSFSPIPLDYLAMRSSSYNEMFLKQTAYPNAGIWMLNNTNCSYMPDSNDPNTYYVAINAIIGAPGGIWKVTKSSNGYSYRSDTAFSSYNRTITLISQDNRNIYYLVHSNSGGSIFYFAILDKTNMSSSYTSFNQSSCKVIKETDMYIYFGANGVNNSHYYIGKYNKTNNTISWIFDEYRIYRYYSDPIASDMENNVFYCMLDSYDNLTDLVHKVGIRKFKYDEVSDTFTSSNVNLNLGTFPSPYIPIYTTDASKSDTVNLFTDRNTNKRYLWYVCHSRNKNANNKDSGLYTFEIIDEDNFKLVSYTSFNYVTYTALLTTNSNQTILLGHPNGVHVYTWDSSSSSFKKVSSFDSPITSFGMDSNNNIYIQYSDSSVEMVSNVISSTVYADFELDEYEYKTTNISTNVLVSVQNYKGKYLSTSIQLILYGNCKFTSNGSKTITITTSSTGKMTIPVTVYDTGDLEVDYKLL